MKLFPSEHEGDARPDTLIYLVVENLDEVAAEFGVPAEDMPWGRREVFLCDPRRQPAAGRCSPGSQKLIFKLRLLVAYEDVWRPDALLGVR